MKHDTNRRVLLVDDNPAIHADYRKILAASAQTSKELDSLADAFFGATTPVEQEEVYELDSAMQGEEALAKLIDARRSGRPFAMAFVDVRMPPGWDGVETLARLWEVDPDLQAVICTAFSDYSYEQMLGKLGRSQNLLILKKPFDTVEVQQLASALTQKWSVTLSEKLHLGEVRAYASSLETVNRALTSDKAMAEAFASARSDIVLCASRALLVPEPLEKHLDPAVHSALRRARQVALLLQFEFAGRERDHAPQPVDIATDIAAFEAAAARAGIRASVQRAPSASAVFTSRPNALRGLFEDVVDTARAGSAAEVRLDLDIAGGMQGQHHLRMEVHLGGPGACFDRIDLGTEPFRAESSGFDLCVAVARRRAATLGADFSAELVGPGQMRWVAVLDVGEASTGGSRRANGAAA